jgi:hypothetical protein
MIDIQHLSFAPLNIFLPFWMIATLATLQNTLLIYSDSFPIKYNKFQVCILGFVKYWVGTSFALIHVDI